MGRSVTAVTSENRVNIGVRSVVALAGRRRTRRTLDPGTVHADILRDAGLGWMAARVVARSAQAPPDDGRGHIVYLRTKGRTTRSIREGAEP